jgi:hypothetical protein
VINLQKHLKRLHCQQATFKYLGKLLSSLYCYLIVRISNLASDTILGTAVRPSDNYEELNSELMTMDFEGIAELADPTFTPFIKCFVLRIQQ